MWSPAASRARLRPQPEQPQAARALPRLPHHRQQHRRAQRGGVRAAGNRRRSLPLERGVPDAGAPASDAGLERARRHLARSVLRAEARAGHADPVDAAVHRERRSGRRLRLRLFLRLHRHDQLGEPDRAAADDARSARRVRLSCSASARRPPSAPPSGAPTSSILDWIADEVSRLCAAGSGRPIAHASPTTSTTSARSSAGFRRSRPTTPAASRATCPRRRWACPTRSPSTSS